MKSGSKLPEAESAAKRSPKAGSLCARSISASIVASTVMLPVAMLLAMPSAMLRMMLAEVGVAADA